MTRKAYMIGAGIGNLAAAAYLIRDGHWNGSQITVMGLDAHGANDGDTVSELAKDYATTPVKNFQGFVNRGGRMLNEATYENLWDLFRSIPSLDHPGKSVTEEILEFDHAHPTHDTGRLLDEKHGPRASGDDDDTRHMQFDNRERALLTKLITLPESRESELDDLSIEQWFGVDSRFFRTNFWRMWETTFAFLRKDSVMELRRYMNRMILEFTRINTLEGVTRTPYNQYESLILPLRSWLQSHGVTLISRRKVTAFDFADSPLHEDIIVTGLEYEDLDEPGVTKRIDVGSDDLVFATNGSITDSTSLGDLDHAIVEDLTYAPSAALWKQAASRFYNLGHPDKFFGDRSQSEWTSFTITTTNHLLLDEISTITRQRPGNALNTFVDSNDVLSIVVHHQPHYHAQTAEQGVLWGYSLYPRRRGDFVDKPFIEMTGREMLEELLGQLDRVDQRATTIAARRDEILESIINVVPAHMPYASALFARRAVGDRPLVVPERSHNLAFVSQFVEMPFDMVFTEQYSIRAAQIAVYTFLGIPESQLTKLHHYERDPRVLAKAALTMFR